MKLEGIRTETSATMTSVFVRTQVTMYETDPRTDTQSTYKSTRCEVDGRLGTKVRVSRCRFYTGFSPELE